MQTILILEKNLESNSNIIINKYNTLSKKGNIKVITDNGKYMYYYSKVDYDYNNYTYSGTLSRIKISKISDDIDKNEDNEEKISNDVDPNLLSQILKTVTGIC